MTYGTVGYLPVGQIVFLDACASRITVSRPAANPMATGTTEEVETYCPVTAVSGLDGLVRSDRVVRLEGRVAIATGDAELTVFAEGSNSPFSDPIGSFSRSEGTYVDVLDEAPEFFRVRMPWSDPKGIVGVLMRDPSSYVVVDEATQVAVPVSFESAIDTVTERFERMSGFPLRELLDGLSKRFDQIYTIEDLSALMCSLDVKAFAELGISAFGSGAGVRAELRLSSPGISHDYDLEVMRVGDVRLRTLATVKRFQCDGSRPDRMDALWISGEPSRTEENELFVLHRGAEDAASIRQGGRQSMFTIDGNDGHYDFERIRRQLRIAAEDNVWLDAVHPWEREIILDYILRKVTFVSSSAR